jgi:hypothetical protein
MTSLTTQIDSSRAKADLSISAGLKAFAFDSGPPPVGDQPAATYEHASDEHGRLGISAATNRLALGDKIRHCYLTGPTEIACNKFRYEDRASPGLAGGGLTSPHRLG